MDLTKQCANCGYNHNGSAMPSRTNVVGPDGREVTPEYAPEVKSTGECPRCRFPIGYPRQPLTDPNGNRLDHSELKTLEQIEAESGIVVTKPSVQQASEIPLPEAPQPKPPDTPEDNPVTIEANPLPE
ncbi:MAG TPA: hypothetical protein VN519_06780 [Bryobacteraceae bacterium]|nr:hypothetical protein [Bryobacteraceae bacterium]